MQPGRDCYFNLMLKIPHILDKKRRGKTTNKCLLIFV